MDIAKAIFGGKFINLNNCIRNQERLKTNELFSSRRKKMEIRAKLKKSERKKY